MSNLLIETKHILKRHGKTLFNVVWVGCADFQISISQFVECANQEYDRMFGAPEVATDLLVVGSDFWLERHEYDGSEWWEYKELPKMPHETRSIHRVMGGAWDTLEELNKEGQTMTLFEYGKSVLEAWDNFIETLIYSSPIGGLVKRAVERSRRWRVSQK